MTPDLLLAIGPSFVAIAVAVIGAVTQSRSRIAEDARFAAQRDADDKRWLKQWEADESRTKLQISAEAEALAAAHRRSIELKMHEERSALDRERGERLRREAATFVTVFGEAQSAAASISEKLERAVSANDWKSHDACFQDWTGDLQARMATAASMMRIIGGDDVANFAKQAHQNLRLDIDLMADLYRQLSPSCSRFFAGKYDSEIESFANAVSNELTELADIR